MDAIVAEEYVSVAEAASLLKVNRSTIRRWITEGKLPAFRIGERRLALRRTDVANLIRPTHPVLAANAVLLPAVLTRQHMTPAEQQQAREAVLASRRLLAEQRAARAGQPFAPGSVELLGELREERSAQQS